MVRNVYVWTALKEQQSAQEIKINSVFFPPSNPGVHNRCAASAMSTRMPSKGRRSIELDERNDFIIPLDQMGCVEYIGIAWRGFETRVLGSCAVLQSLEYFEPKWM